MEPYIAYIHDVLALCRKANDKVAKIENFGCILKSIVDNVFNLSVFRNYAIVQCIFTECRRSEQAKNRHITHQFTMLPNTAAI